MLFSLTLHLDGCTFPFRRRQWQPTPVLLPGKSHARRSLVGCSLWGHEESDTTERLHFQFHALEKEMATHSSVLAWRIPGTEEPGGLPSMGSHRVGHHWSDLAVVAAPFPFFLAFWFSSFFSYLKTSSDNHAFLLFFFLWDGFVCCLLYGITDLCP